MLIAGCSHAAGAEIDGTDDSIYNRKNSYGNLLSEKLNRQPINIASSGSTNSSITRSILEWFSTNYDPEVMDVFVLVSWTESSRLELPVDREIFYSEMNNSSDWKSKTEQNYLRINQGWAGGDNWEKELLPGYQEFIAQNLELLEIISVNLVLQLQYFFKLQKVNYLMCNSMHMFTPTIQLKFYLNLIDKSNYINYIDNDKSFYWKYRNRGFLNSKAKYWHHDEIPHMLYAEELYRFIQNNPNKN